MEHEGLIGGMLENGGITWAVDSFAKALYTFSLKHLFDSAVPDATEVNTPRVEHGLTGKDWVEIGTWGIVVKPWHGVFVSVEGDWPNWDGWVIAEMAADWLLKSRSPPKPAKHFVNLK